MEIVLISCLIVFTIFVCFALFYFILTLSQVSKLVRDIDVTVKEANTRIKKVNRVIDLVSDLTDASFSGLLSFSRKNGPFIRGFAILIEVLSLVKRLRHK